MRKRWSRVLIAAAVILILGAIGVLGFRHWRAEQAQAASCEAMKAQLSARGEVVTVGDGDPKIAVLGDSYSTGDMLSDWRDAWPFALQDATGATVAVAGVGMTGFTNGGYCGGDEFGQRVPTLSQAPADVVIVQGGINDWQADPKAVADAASTVLTAFDVPVILVGPAPSPLRPGTAEVDAALRAASEGAGATYVSMLDASLEFLPDQVHLTEKGHEEFARIIEEALAQAT